MRPRRTARPPVGRLLVERVPSAVCRATRPSRRRCAPAWARPVSRLAPSVPVTTGTEGTRPMGRG